MRTQERFCEVCNVVIDGERCEVLPETQLCTGCARRMTKLGGEFITTVHQERLSKPGSLKLNFGGVSVSKTRNIEGLRKLRAEVARGEG